VSIIPVPKRQVPPREPLTSAREPGKKG